MYTSLIVHTDAAGMHALHSIPSHSITLYYNPSHSFASHHIALHYVTSHQHITSRWHYIGLHHTTLHHVHAGLGSHSEFDSQISVIQTLGWYGKAEMGSYSVSPVNWVAAVHNEGLPQVRLVQGIEEATSIHFFGNMLETLAPQSLFCFVPVDIISHLIASHHITIGHFIPRWWFPWFQDVWNKFQTSGSGCNFISSQHLATGSSYSAPLFRRDLKQFKIIVKRLQDPFWGVCKIISRLVLPLGFEESPSLKQPFTNTNHGLWSACSWLQAGGKAEKVRTKRSVSWECWWDDTGVRGAHQRGMLVTE